MSKQRREEEKKILAEMDEAMKENVQKEETPKKTKSKIFGVFEDKTPEQLHCHKCKALMENGVCPECGFRTYVPMSKEKQQKIRLILTGVFVVAFVILFVWLQIK